jgi:L-iditol 2-dehydrogenase
MKEALLTGIRKIEIKETQKPIIKNDTDILVQIKAVGICGSDVHYYLNGKIGDQVIHYPFRIGHECSGVVAKVGAKVKTLKMGDRIAIDPAISCGLCDQCIMGRHHTCRNLNFLGCPDEMEGCLAEYIVVPEKCCYKLHHSINHFQGVLVEPISIGYYSVNMIKDLKINAVGILGSGPIGLSVLLNAKYSNVKRIYVTDKIDYRIHFAKNLGAYWSGNAENIDIIKEIQKEEPLLLDAVFECCGDQSALDQAIELLKPGGLLIIIGIPTAPRISFNISKIRRKEITIYNIRRQNFCIQPGIEFILNNLSILNSWTTHKFPLKKVQDAFDLVASYQDNVIKAMIEFI